MSDKNLNLPYANTKFKDLKLISQKNILDLLDTEYMLACKNIRNANIFRIWCQYIKSIDFYRIRGHRGQVNCLVHLSDIDKNYILSASSDKTVKVFNLSTCQTIVTYSGHEDAVWCLLRLSKDVFASGSSDKTIRIWKHLSDDCIKIIGENEGLDSSVLSLSEVSSDIFTCGTKDSKIILWRKKSYEKVKVIEPGFCSYYHILKFENKGTTSLIVGGSNNHIFKWDLKKDELELRYIGHRKAVNCFIVYKNEFLISGSLENTIKVWDINVGDCLNTLRNHVDSVTSLQHLYDDILMSASLDGQLILWRLRSFDQIDCILIKPIWPRCRITEDIRVFQSELMAGAGEDNYLYVCRCFKFRA